MSIFPALDAEVADRAARARASRERLRAFRQSERNDCDAHVQAYRRWQRSEALAKPKRTIMDLNDTTCRWPRGDSPNWDWCGGKPVPGLPYCAAHARLAYQPARR